MNVNLVFSGVSAEDIDVRGIVERKVISGVPGEGLSGNVSDEVGIRDVPGEGTGRL
jgi:hypothetical protein